MSFLLRKTIILTCMLSASHAFCDIAFVTGYTDDTIYSFDPNKVYVPRTAYSGQPPYPNNIAFSPDGATVYFTTGLNGDVYSFPTNDPSTVTQLFTGIPGPVGIAISSDGSLGFVATDDPSPGLYSFPTGGSTHTNTLLTPSGSTTIPSPLFVAINGNNAFVGDFQNGTVYRVTLTSTTYDATLIQTFLSGMGVYGNVGGLAISNDGYLYISNGFYTDSMTMLPQICRVSVNDPPMFSPTIMANPVSFSDGLAVSNDGKTVFFTHVFGSDGIFSFPTDQVVPAPITTLSSLNISQAIDIAIAPISIAPPANLTGSQQKNDFVLLFERVNFLQWSPSLSTGVAGYNIYRNGSKIASVNASTFSYQDHNIKKGMTTTYSVSSFDALGNESALVNVEIS